MRLRTTIYINDINQLGLALQQLGISNFSQVLSIQFEKTRLDSSEFLVIVEVDSG